tara:strand:+ start:130 stop:1443 length:1314 start_codon:yes stop_codon:yes gene_type:complete
MALKGIGIASDIYVVQTYYTPETYTTTLPSVGDYVLEDFVASDYVQESLDLTSSFSLSCDGTTTPPVVGNWTSTFTVSVSAEKFDFASASLTSTSSLSCNGGLSLTSTASSSSTTTTSINANQTHRQTKTLTATASLSGSGNVSYTSATASLEAVVSTISVGGIIFNAFQEGRQDDYTWDSFSEDSTIDRTWNEWFGGQWHPGLIAFVKTIEVSVNAGLINTATGTFTTAGDTSVNGNKTTGFATPKDLLLTTSITGDSVRTRNVSASPTGVFSGVFTATILHLGEASLSTAYTIGANGSVSFKASGDYNVASTLSSNANQTHRPTKSLTTTSSTSSNGNVSYKSTILNWNAFNSVLSFGRVITIADPWNILTVPLETRTLVVPIETRVNSVLQETRVNKLITETRKLQVPQETRKVKIFKPTFSNRSSVPKIRSEA